MVLDVNLEKRILAEVETEQKRVWLTNIFEEGLKSEKEETQRSTILELGNVVQYVPDKAEEWFDRGLNSKYINVQEKTITQLGNIVQYIPDKIEKWFEEGLNSKFRNIQYKAIRQLEEIIKYVPDKAEEWFKIGLNTDYEDIQIITIAQLGNITQYIPDKIENLFKMGLNSRFKSNLAQIITIAQLGIIGQYEPKISVDIFNECLNSESKLIKNLAFGRLEDIAHYAPNQVEEWFEKGLNNDSKEIKERIMGQLGVVAQYVPNKAEEWFEKGLSSESQAIQKETMGQLGVVAQYVPYKVKEWFEKGLSSESQEIQEEMIKQLGFIAQYVPNQLEEWFEKGLNSKSPRIQETTIEQLGVIVQSVPEKVNDLFEKGLNNKSPRIQEKTIEQLGLIVEYAPEKVVDLFEKGLNNFLKYVQIATIKQLGVIAQHAPKKVEQWFEKILKIAQIEVDDKYLIEDELNNQLEDIIKYNPMPIIKYGLSSFNKKVQFLSFNQLEQFPIINYLINPPEHSFIKQYLKSEYVNGRSEKDIISELKKLVQTPSKNYELMIKVLQSGKAKNLEDIIECLKLSIPGNYLALSKAGEGATARVYRIKDHREDVDLALKVSKRKKELKGLVAKLIHKQNLSTQEGRFARKTSKHPNVIEFYQFIDGVTFKGEKVDALLYEFIDGPNLKEKIKQEGIFSEKVLYNIFSQMLNGIEHIHKTHTHRDINLSNTMYETSTGNVKISDPGMGVLLGTESERTGARQYRAPESFIKCFQYKTQSDIWSLGATLYELSTGKELFPESLKERLEFMLQDNGTHVNIQRRIRRNVPKYLQTIVKKALQRNPKNRYQNISELKNALDLSFLPQEIAIEKQQLEARLKEIDDKYM